MPRASTQAVHWLHIAWSCRISSVDLLAIAMGRPLLAWLSRHQWSIPANTGHHRHRSALPMLHSTGRWHMQCKANAEQSAVVRVFRTRARSQETSRKKREKFNQKKREHIQMHCSTWLHICTNRSTTITKTISRCCSPNGLRTRAHVCEQEFIGSGIAAIHDIAGTVILS